MTTGPARMRHLSNALNHEETRLVTLALLAYADMVSAVDRSFPHPDHRASAVAAEKLSALFRDTNIARKFMTQEDPS